MGLKNLDDKLVPDLASRLRSLLLALTGRRTAAAERAHRLVEPGRSGPLRRLDDRFASTGPLALLRDVPQLGLLVVAVVFLTGAGVALARNAPESVREREQQQAEAALPLALGPAPGTQVDVFFAAARERAVALSRRSPDERHLALVTLSDELTPDLAQRLFAESKLSVRRAYVRAPTGGANAEILPVDVPGDLVGTLESLFAETARRKAAEQQEFLKLATSEGSTPEFAKTYRDDARKAGLEAAAYRTPCACVFAIVVEGSARELAELPALPAVRGVELAPLGAELVALDIVPLPPDVKGVLPKPKLPGS